MGPKNTKQLDSNSALKKDFQSSDNDSANQNTAKALNLISNEVYDLQNALPKYLDLFYYIDSQEMLSLEIGDTTSQDRLNEYCNQINKQFKVQSEIHRLYKKPFTDEEFQQINTLLKNIRYLNGFHLNLCNCHEISDASIDNLTTTLTDSYKTLNYLKFELKRCSKLYNPSIKSIVNCAWHFKNTLLHFDLILEASYVYFKELSTCFDALRDSLYQCQQLIRLNIHFENCDEFQTQKSFFEAIIHLKELLELSLYLNNSYYGPLEMPQQNLIIQVFNQNYYLNNFSIFWHKRDHFRQFLKSIELIMNKRRQANRSRILQFSLVQRTLNRRMRKEVSWEIFRDFLNSQQ